MDNAAKKFLLCGALLAATGLAWSHGEEHGHQHAAAPAGDGQTAWGRPGDAKGARTIEITMGDDMRFRPDRIEVREGETVRLSLRNAGAVLHELVIGTPAELAAHAEMMKRMPGMAHDAPSMSHVAAGRRGELVWTFNRPGTFAFACLIPGHFEAGMKGTIEVAPQAQHQHQHQH